MRYQTRTPRSYNLFTEYFIDYITQQLNFKPKFDFEKSEQKNDRKAVLIRNFRDIIQTFDVFDFDRRPDRCLMTVPIASMFFTILLFLALFSPHARSLV